MSNSTIATAYVQVIPSAKGIKNNLKEAFGKEGEGSGESFGQRMIGKIKGLIATAGIGKMLADTIKAGGALEQSLGGVETLFKESASKVIENANQAYKTSGLSANAYMEQVTSFSASLLQSLGGDTEAAADAADMALRDMSDNANKFGTDMQLIQNAYQGFAKQNYTMLDNLKLGYGGTKTEMERLLKDAQALTGVKYDINNLNDVYQAIHAVQKELGVTGTTAKEASTTIAGSMSAMKAAFENVLGSLALGESIAPALGALGDTVFTFFADNLLPMVGNVLSQLPEVLSSAFFMAIRGMNLVSDNMDGILMMGIDLVTGIGEAIIAAIPYLAESAWSIVSSIGEFLITADWASICENVITGIRESLDIAAGEILGTDGNIIESLLNAIRANLPSVLAEGINIITSLANGLLSASPGVISAAGEIMNSLIGAIGENLPVLMESGVALIEKLGEGIMNNLPAILSAAKEVMSKMLSTIEEHLPKILQSGIELIGRLGNGMKNNLPAVATAIGDILGDVLRAIADRLPEILESGVELIMEFAVGMINAIPEVIDAIFTIGDRIKESFSDFDWDSIGKKMMEGIKAGISAGASAIASAARSAASRALQAAKNFLGIASPSKVMRDQIGKFIPAGIAVGIEANTKPIVDAMDALSGETVDAFSLNGGKTRSIFRESSVSNAYRNTSISINVYPAQGQDEEEIAQSVMQRLQFLISREEASVAHGCS